MGWLVTALAIVWLAPSAAAAVAALACLFSRPFRAWLTVVLLGDTPPDYPAGAATGGRSAER